MSKYNQIRQIVKIKQMLKRWRTKARESSSAQQDVPAGHVVVCVGPARRRYVIRTTHLNHPLFHALLDQAQEEYGFAASGPLAIPNCDEPTFEEIIRVVSAPPDHPSRLSACHMVAGLVGIIQGGGSSNGGDSWPLLRG